MIYKRFVDVLLILIGGVIILISSFYIEEGLSRWGGVLLGAGLVIVFFTLAVWEKKRNLIQQTIEDFDNTAFCKVKSTEVVLLSEEDRPMASWSLYGKVSMVIGRDVGENQVNINLSASTYASMIEVEHAVLNYSSESWYVEDLASKNGVSVKKHADGRKYKLAANQPCKLDSGDIIYIGLTRLMIR
ncbi:MAG: FHA domain-containing protein [Butyricicoccus sp.]